MTGLKDRKMAGFNMDDNRVNDTALLIQALDNIAWSTMRPDEQTWVLRALVKSAQGWQIYHGLEPTIGATIARSSGYCHCCRLQSIFSSNDGWLRDHYVCSNCGSVPRERNLMRALDELVPAWTGKVIHESSPSNMRLKNLAKSYTYSFYEPEVPSGSKLPNGGTSENLESLSIATGSLDVFISQDVLEHVFNPAVSVEEVMRTLRPGGWYIFTTPRHHHLSESVQRARLEDKEIVHILEPAYHGSPIGDGRVLVTFDWGRDLEALLEHWSGYKVLTRATPDPSRGIDGDSFEVFAIQKS